MLGTQFVEKVSLNHLKCYQPSKFLVIKSSEILGWQSIKSVEMIHRGFRIEFPPDTRHLVILILNSASEIEVEIGGRKFEQPVREGAMVIVPAKASAIFTRQDEEEFRVLQLYLEPYFVKRTAENYDLGSRTAVEPAVELADEQLRRIALSLLHELQQANLSSRFFAEVLASALALQIVRRSEFSREVSVQSKGGISQFKLRQALEYVERNLENGESISLEKIAASVGISYFHFSRAFKQSMGVSPNKYIATRRIERAKKLLAQTDDGIADIALQVGFSSQSHFTMMFQRLIGTTPKMFRMAL